MQVNPRLMILLASPLAIAGCTVVPPDGPSVMALPGKEKTFDAFQRDDAMCRQFAFQQNGGVQPADAATNSAVGSAVVGTALGAVAGAAIGSVTGQMGAGAAIGAAGGLLAGSAVGAGNAQVSSAGLQQRYDIAYTQCMYAQGDTVQTASPGYGYAGYAGYPGYDDTPGYGYPPGYGFPAYYAPPPVYYAPSVIVGGGWGWGGGYRGGWGGGYPGGYRRYR
jgi:outer membrane lipoprotein SlyB